MILCNPPTKTSSIEACWAIGRNLHHQANVRVVWDSRTTRTIQRVPVKKGFQIQLVALMSSFIIGMMQVFGICLYCSLVLYAPCCSASPCITHVSTLRLHLFRTVTKAWKARLWRFVVLFLLRFAFSQFGGKSGTHIGLTVIKTKGFLVDQSWPSQTVSCNWLPKSMKDKRWRQLKEKRTSFSTR